MSEKLNRREVVAALLHERSDLLVVAGLGAPAYDVAACGDSPRDFPLWGAMGGAAMIGLGLALAQPQQRVLVLTGDGEMLMGLGSLATMGTQRPPNLRTVVLDNERYGETGQQRTHTGMGVDLTAVAQACGIAHATTIHHAAALPDLRHAIHTLNDTLFAVIKVSPVTEPKVLPPRDGPFLTHRFQTALLGERVAVNG
ncbi:MAG: hypothetical protein KC423_14485 [Anaerolineales bacterium]|nr:hypothetical protein [Anaerolineales bacterium]